MNVQSTAFKALPSVEKVLQADVLQPLILRIGQTGVKLEARARLSTIRRGIQQNDNAIINWVSSQEFFSEFCQQINKQVAQSFAGSLIPVINLTGTVVHTNLGRASLPQEAITAMQVVGSQPVNLEYDLDIGKRGDRDHHLEKCICELTGAEAATVVNNNAAAVLLVLNTLAFEQEVLISRGELVEIGGAFRIPDVMTSANCRLKEIGTTNRTHLRDYEAAINADTGMIMRVHTSNYEIRGFTNSVPAAELSALAASANLPFVSDLGSGTLVDLQQYGLPHEPTVREELEQGADLVTFSGDKLLGGPQAGLIVGKADLVSRIKANPLKRALRIDKLTLAALFEVINLYRDPQRLAQRLPLLVDMTRPVDQIQAQAECLLPIFQKQLQSIAEVAVCACRSQIGSGSLPLDLLASFGLSIKPIAQKGQTDVRLQQIARAFRRLPRPVIGRIHDGCLILDLRCLQQDSDLIDQLPQLEL
jgi:L-seryl-tRNA(Ser) seleniumtransferase